MSRMARDLTESMEDVTFLLNDAQQRGSRRAWNLVYEHSYRRLHRIAAALLRRERRGHSLPATALVGESFLRLNRMLKPILGREHFFSLSAHVMKQALIDHARRRKVRRLDAESVAALLAFLNQPSLDAESTVAVRRALDELAQLDPLAARCLQLRYVEGCTLDDAARQLGRDPWDAKRDCQFGLRWLADHLN